MFKFKEMNSEDIACLLAIIIGGLFAINNPDKMGEAFEYTVGGIILIKLFW